MDEVCKKFRMSQFMSLKSTKNTFRICPIHAFQAHFGSCKRKFVLRRESRSLFIQIITVGHLIFHIMLEPCLNLHCALSYNEQIPNRSRSFFIYHSRPIGILAGTKVCAFLSGKPVGLKASHFLTKLSYYHVIACYLLNCIACKVP